MISSAKDGDYTSIVADKIDGADFSDTALNDAFFEKVSYKGAFDGKNDWAANGPTSIRITLNINLA